MKQNCIIIFIILLFFKISYSQESKTNCVIYKVDRYVMANEAEVKEDETLKAFRALEYQLIYDLHRSVYKPIEKLEDYEENEEYKFAKFVAGYFFFKDILSKEKIETSEIQDEEFNIIKNFEEYKWQITGETKMINSYTCYKATTHIEEKDLVRDRVNNFYPVVWFAPSIPVPFGPSGLDGLPGLVLEATFNGKIYYYATKINFNCVTNILLEKPDKGKYVTQKEFSEINARKFNEMINSSR